MNAWRAARGGEHVLAGSPSDLAAQIARVDSAVASSPSREAGRAALRKRNSDKAAKRRKPAVAAPLPAPTQLTVYPLPSTVSRIDLDLAPAAAIESLPRIGPALAARIVANRDSFGAFGSLEGLQRVRGIGPALTKGLRERVAFSGIPREGVPTAKSKASRRPAAP